MFVVKGWIVMFEFEKGFDVDYTQVSGSGTLSSERCTKVNSIEIRIVKIDFGA